MPNPGQRRACCRALLLSATMISYSVVLVACGDDTARIVARKQAQEQHRKEVDLLSDTSRAGPEIERRLRERIQSNGSIIVIKEDSSSSLSAMPANVVWTARCSLSGLWVSFGVTGDAENGNSIELWLSYAGLDEQVCKELIQVTG